jgi:hypothetical protein
MTIAVVLLQYRLGAPGDPAGEQHHGDVPAEIQAGGEMTPRLENPEQRKGEKRAPRAGRNRYVTDVCTRRDE